MHEYMLQQPLWLMIWLGWMGVVNMASIFFLRHAEARWVLIAFLCNLVFMNALFAWNGYNRLLGLSHVVWWTPLLVLLFRRRAFAGGAGAFRTWIAALFYTNLISLVVDYADVVRYLLGDRS